MSTGAHEQAEVQEAVEVLRENGVDDIALLHCVSSYPTPLEEINVRAVETLQCDFDTVVGFSDHTVEPAVAPAAAVALGASIVEKHFTLNKEMNGPDHSFAVEPEELNEMVNKIRQTETVLGDGVFSMSTNESGVRNRARRGIFASRSISAGQKINEVDLQVLRPGTAQNQGLHPKYFDDVVGAQLTVDIDRGDPVTAKKLSDFQ